MRLSATLTGVENTLAKFETLKRGARNKYLRKAVRAASDPQLKASRAAMTFRNDTGVLRKSLIKKIRTFPSGITTAIVGPRKESVLATDRGGRQVIRNPNNYAHLVEFGHRIAVSRITKRSQYRHILIRRGKTRIATSKNPFSPNVEALHSGDVPARQFMRPGFVSSQGAATYTFTKKLTEDLMTDAKVGVPSA